MGATIPPLSKPKESCQVNSHFHCSDFTLSIVTLALCVIYYLIEIRNSHLKPNTVKIFKVQYFKKTICFGMIVTLRRVAVLVVLLQQTLHLLSLNLLFCLRVRRVKSVLPTHFYV